jgi:hypothetical protein
MKGVAWRGVARSRIVDSCFPYPYSLLKGAQQLPHLRMYEVIKLLAGVVMVDLQVTSRCHPVSSASAASAGKEAKGQPTRLTLLRPVVFSVDFPST